MVSNDSVRTFYQQPSNVIKGLVDTLHEEGSVTGSVDSLCHPFLTSTVILQKTSTFRPDERHATGKITNSPGRPKLIIETSLRASASSPRSIHNASNMQKAAIMNTISKDNSPSIQFYSISPK